MDHVEPIKGSQPLWRLDPTPSCLWSGGETVMASGGHKDFNLTRDAMDRSYSMLFPKNEWNSYGNKVTKSGNQQQCISESLWVSTSSMGPYKKILAYDSVQLSLSIPQVRRMWYHEGGGHGNPFFFFIHLFSLLGMDGACFVRVVSMVDRSWQIGTIDHSNHNRSQQKSSKCNTSVNHKMDWNRR